MAFQRETYLERDTTWCRYVVILIYFWLEYHVLRDWFSSMVASDNAKLFWMVVTKLIDLRDGRKL